MTSTHVHVVAAPTSIRPIPPKISGDESLNHGFVANQTPGCVVGRAQHEQTLEEIDERWFFGWSGKRVRGKDLPFSQPRTGDGVCFTLLVNANE